MAQRYKRGSCPSCSYPLTQISDRSDATTTCPECGETVSNQTLREGLPFPSPGRLTLWLAFPWFVATVFNAILLSPFMTTIGALVVIFPISAVIVAAPFCSLWILLRLHDRRAPPPPDVMLSAPGVSLNLFILVNGVCAITHLFVLMGLLRFFYF